MPLRCNAQACSTCTAASTQRITRHATNAGRTSQGRKDSCNLASPQYRVRHVNLHRDCSDHVCLQPCRKLLSLLNIEEAVPLRHCPAGPATGQGERTLWFQGGAYMALCSPSQAPVAQSESKLLPAFHAQSSALHIFYPQRTGKQ